MGDLVDLHPGEDAQLDDLNHPGIHLAQPGQRALEVENRNLGVAMKAHILVEGDPLPSTSALDRSSLSSVLDEDLSHGAGSDPKEVGTILPVDAGAVDQAEIGLIDKGGGLESVIRPLVVHHAAGELPELAVDGFEDSIRDLSLIRALDLCVDEDLSDLLPGRFAHRSPLHKIGQRQSSKRIRQAAITYNGNS
jgi:hypothetical protein